MNEINTTQPCEQGASVAPEYAGFSEVVAVTQRILESARVMRDTPESVEGARTGCATVLIRRGVYNVPSDSVSST